MTRWVVIFEDHDEEVSRPIRTKLSEKHFDYLASNKSQIVLAGGLRPDDTSWFSGGLWIVESESRSLVESLVLNDPYSIAGLRKSHSISHWGKAPCYGDVVL